VIRYGQYGRKASWIVIRLGKYKRKLWKDRENIEENREMISKIWTKDELNIEMIWKIQKEIVKWYGKYGRKVCWILKSYGKCGRKVGWIVKWYGQYGRKVSWRVKWYW
jgi:hypothetical protein